GADPALQVPRRRRTAARQRLQAARRVADARRDVPGPALRRRGEEDRQRPARAGGAERAGDPRGRGVEDADRPPVESPGSPDGAADAPGRPRAGRVPQRAHPPPRRGAEGVTRPEGARGMKPCISEATTLPQSFAEDVHTYADVGCPAVEVWLTKLEDHLQ